MEKTDLMLKYEKETGETLDMAILAEDASGSWYGYIDMVDKKAAAYDRLMSGGKKTLKEWANFIGKPIAMNENGEWYWYSTNVHRGCNIWYPNNGRSPSGMLPFYLIDFSGDWKDSLTLPDGWEEK